MTMKKREDIVKCDFLIVGGGIAGMQAAITASSLGMDVVVAEKADTRRSGSGATGNDHFICYIPEYHGDDFEEILREVSETLVGPWQDKNLLSLMLRRSQEVIELWESYGINMRPTGEWNFEGHSMPGRRRYHLKYDGHDQKPLLTKQALKNGCHILNKTTVNELLTNETGRVVGAIGVNIADEKPELIVFQAKAVLVCTGHSVRIYPGMNPAYPFNACNCPADTGSGIAMGFRAGARLVNLDIPYVHSGPSMFQRCGKATWIGVLTDYYGKPVGPFVTKPTRELGDVTADIWQTVFREKMQDGTGPVFMNCSETSQEDMEHMFKSFVSEGDTSLIDYMEQYHIDLRKHMVEFNTYEYNYTARGLDIGIDGMTTVSGLFAAGNITGNVRGDISSAAVFGHVDAESACEYIKTVEEYDISNHPKIAETLEMYSAIMERETGAHWKEANSTMQQIMNKYVGTEVRSETLLKSGIKYIGDLKRYANEQLRAENSHELMRCLEVLDMLDVAEASAISAEGRKETRGKCHNRVDYTYTNPLLNNKFQTIEKTRDGLKLAYREKVR